MRYRQHWQIVESAAGKVPPVYLHSLMMSDTIESNGSEKVLRGMYSSDICL